MSLPANMIEDLVRTGIVKRVWEDREVKIDLPKETAKTAVEPKWQIVYRKLVWTSYTMKNNR